MRILTVIISLFIYGCATSGQNPTRQFASITSFNSTSEADSKNTSPIPETEEKLLINYFHHFTYELTQPIYVYNWWDTKNAPEKFRNQISAHDSIGFKDVTQMSQLYWRDKGQKTGGINQGAGLYVATDAAATRGFAGDQWLLTQIRLPIGFRIIDLNDNVEEEIPEKILSILKTSNCIPTDHLSNRRKVFNYLFGTELIDKSCINLLHRIVDDVLQVDAFAYSYRVSPLKECVDPFKSSNEISFSRNSAMVIISNRSLAPKDVLIFNQKTSDEQENRIIIQSLFYKANCSSFPMTIGTDPNCHESLWTDLIGNSTTADIGNWISNYVYGCSGEAPYRMVD